jgi:hypothetical protein
MWQEVSQEIRRSAPHARHHAEKIVGDTGVLLDSGIQTHLIDLVRDPRDIFCSIRAFKAGSAGFGRTRGQTDEQFLEAMIVRQRAQLRRMASTSGAAIRTLIRYEDLIADLNSTAEGLGGWLGLRFNPAQLLRISDQDRLHMTSRTRRDSVGRWRRELSPTLAERLWSALGPELEAMGYAAGVISQAVKRSCIRTSVTLLNVLVVTLRP